jgi:predicted ATP-grasp superfamily ATP-dependent carboligase
VDLNAFFHHQFIDPQIDSSIKQVNADKIISPVRKISKIDLCIVIYPDIIFTAQMDLRSAISYSKFIPFNQGQIYDSFLITKVS